MRAARKDSNHNEVASDLGRLSFWVLDLSRLGSGYPDMAVMKHGRALLVELKRPKARATGRKKRRTAERQMSFRETWDGCPTIQAETVEEILKAWTAFHGGL